MNDTMSLLSPKMASKRLSDADTIYPPKKRALYEHMKLHGIDKFTTNHMTANGILDYQNNLRVYGMSFPVSVDIKHSETYPRPRSDSLQSQLSSNSDHTETGSTESRETSPCTIQALFDHHTPERNPITSLDGLKPDISKPLFPPSDSDNSTAGSEGHLSPDNSLYGEQDESKSKHSESVKIHTNALKASDQGKNDKLRIENLITADRRTFRENIPENVTATFHENSATNSSFQNENIPTKDEGLHARDNVKFSSTGERQREVYMGPMVSLLQRFNAEALQSSGGIQIKEQKKEAGVAFNYPSQQSEAFTQLTVQNDENVYHMSGEVSGVPSERIYCRLCHKEFATRAYLHSHMKTHENKSIPCWVCKDVFQTAEGLSVHMKMEHKGENPYKCEHCSREFTQYNNLRRHMRVHREKVYKCNLCNREFNEEFYLKMHMGTHTGKRMYSCGVCGEGFPSNHDLKMHVKTHSPSLLHTCNVCGKSFSKACVLRQHKKGHSGERPHKCDKCEKTFIHRHHLTMHLKSHVDEKRLSCDICKKDFSQHSHLYKHLRAHEESKDFVKSGKPGRNVKNEGNRNSEIRETTVSNEVNFERIPKVVLTSDEFSSKSLKYESFEKHFVADGMKETSKPPKQGKRTVSCHSLPQNSHNTLTASVTETSHAPSVSQTYSHQMGRYPSMPFMHGMPQSYLPGSPAHPLHLQNVYSALHRNRVQVPGPGYQPYSQLYRNYSEQMQTYYNNMYMMNYLSQNATLQNVKGDGQSFPNLPENDGLMQRKESERSNQLNSFEIKHILKPKVVQGVEKLDLEKIVNVEKDKNLKNETKTDKGVPEIENIDVVNETIEHEPETLESGRDAEINVKVGSQVHTRVAESEEHEIAQELLKMSAGNKGNLPKPEMKISEFMKQDRTPNKDIGMPRMNFTNCISDIIERTIRNNNRKTESTNVPKTGDTVTLNFSPFINVANSDEQQQVDVSESVTQQMPISYLNLKPGDVNGIAESPTSPLQKLKMFVASEETSFNETESVNENSSSLIYHENEQINIWSENTEAVSDVLGKPESEFFERPVKVMDDNVVEAENDTKAVEDSLEMRLEKIRQFADIGQRLGKIQREVDIMNNEFENMARSHESSHEREKHCDEYCENEVFGNTYKMEQPSKDVKNNSSEEVKDVNSEREMADVKLDSAAYFDDSLEDRQLEIIENDSVRDDFEGARQSSESETNEENRGELSKSSEKEFLCHMSHMINDSQEKSEDRLETKEASIKVIDNDSKSEENIEDVNKQTHSNNVYSNDIKDEVDNSLKHEHGNMRQFQGLETEKENTCIGLIVRPFDDKPTEGEAIDLRTEIRQKESVVSEYGYAVRDIQQRFENENMPMDLSLNGKSKHHVDERVEESENVRLNGDNRHNKGRSPEALHYDNLYFCQFCDRTFDDSEKWTEHVNFHKTMDKPYMCNTCNRCFAHRHNLNRHKMSHNSKSYECNLCKRSFKESFYLQMHMKTHAEENRHRCQICGQNVPKSEIWQHTSQHLVSVSENPTYQQIGYRVQEILREQNLNMNGVPDKLETEKLRNEHLKIPVVNGMKEDLRIKIKLGEMKNEIDPHIGEALNLKKENIENWNVRKDKSDNGIDMRKMLNLKLNEVKRVSVLTERKMEDTLRNSGGRLGFECSVCNKVLQSKHELGNHMGFHKGTRPYVCNICGRAFKKSRGLRIHEKLHLQPSIQVQ